MKEVEVHDQPERDARIVVIGIITFALAVVIITLGFSNVAGWSPRNYTANV